MIFSASDDVTYVRFPDRDYNVCFLCGATFGTTGGSFRGLFGSRGHGGEENAYVLMVDKITCKILSKIRSDSINQKLVLHV